MCQYANMPFIGTFARWQIAALFYSFIGTFTYRQIAHYFILSLAHRLIINYL
jgi:hypothetical protein